MTTQEKKRLTASAFISFSGMMQVLNQRIAEQEFGSVMHKALCDAKTAFVAKHYGEYDWDSPIVDG